MAYDTPASILFDTNSDAIGTSSSDGYNRLQVQTELSTTGIAITDGVSVTGTSSNPLRIDPTGTTTQPISVSTLPLPSGAATEATLSNILTASAFDAKINTFGQKDMDHSTPVVISSDQTSLSINDGGSSVTIDGYVNTIQSGIWTVQPGNTANTTPWLTSISQGGNTVSVSGANALVVDGSGVIQPVSGTITANAGTGTFGVSGTVTSNIGTTNGLALDFSVQKLTIAQSAALGSNTQTMIGGSVLSSAPTYTSGNINPISLTTSGAVRVDASAVTQPVSGTITANAGTGNFTVIQNTASNLNATVIGSTAAGSGASTGLITVQGNASGTAIPVSGTITANAGTGNFTVTQSTASNLRSQIASEGSTGSTIPTIANLAGGSVTTSAPTYTTGNLGALSLTTGGLLRVDGSAITQPVSGTVSATQSGTWTIQPGNTANTTPWLSTINQGGNSATVSAGGALKVDGSASTQPVSGTITSNIGTTNGLALDATIQKLTVAQGSSLGSNTQALIGGSVTTSAPSYTTGNINPFSLTTTGSLRVDGSGATQPVSGTITANAGTGNFTIVQSTASSLNATIVGTTAAGSGASSGLITIQGNASGTPIPVTGSISATNPSVSNTAATPPSSATYIGGSVTTSVPTYTTGQMNALSLTTTGLLRVDNSAITQTVIGNATDNTSNPTTKLSVIAALANTSAPTWSDGNQVPLSVDTSGALRISGSITASNPSVSATGSSPPASATYIGGSVTTAAPTYTTGQISALSLNTGGSLRVDGSGNTQPISGTVAVTQGTASNLNATIIGTTAAGSGASSGLITIQGNASGTPIPITGSITATNPSVSTTGSSPPSSATYIGGSVSTNSPLYTNGQMSGLSLTTTGALRVESISDGYVSTSSPTYTNNTVQNLSLTTAGALRTDSSGTTQPVSGTVAATQSGTWTIQPGNTANTTPWLSTINQGGNSATVSAGGALKVDGSAVTQPVSGTITANIGTTNGLALDASIAKLTISQGTALGSNTQALIGGSVTTAAPSYTTGNINPLSLTTAGLLRIDGSGVTQPISGTITANAGTGNFTVVQATASNLNATVVQGTAANLRAQTAAESSTGSTIPSIAALIGGSVTTAAPTYTTGNLGALSLTTGGLLRTDGSSVTQPISGTITANIGTTNGLALDATLAKLTIAQSTALGSNTQSLIGGSVTTSAPTYTTGNINPLSLTTTGLLRVDGSGVTQPVSGTITANAGTGTFTVSGTVAATQSGTWTVQPGNTANTTPWLSTINQGGNSATVSAGGALKVDGSAATQPVSGTITSNIGTTNGLALDATVTKLTIAQGTALGSNTQALIGGSVTTAAPTYTTGNINPLSLTTTGLLRVDGSGVTQTVSGTVTANAGTGNFTVVQSTAANLNATIIGTTAAGSGASSGLITVQGNASGTPIPISGTVTATNPSVSTTAASPPSSATYIGGSVTTSAPTYTTGQMNPLSLTTGGLLRVDGSGSTQPISGTIAATQSGTWTVQPGNTANTTPWLATINQGGNSATVSAGGALKVDGSAATQPVSGTVTSNIGTTNGLSLDATLVKLTIAQSTALGSNTQALIGGSVTTSAPTYTTGNINPISLTTSGAVRVDASATTQPVSGTITANAGTGNFTVVQATASNLKAQIASEATTATTLGTIASLIGGSVTTSAPSYTTGQMNALSLTTAGALRTDSSGTTQPVSGTIAATQSGTWTMQPGNTANTTPWLATINQGGNSATVSAGGALKVDGSAVTQPVSGTVTSNIGTTNGLALDATVTKLTISQGTALGSNTQSLMGGSVTTAAPTYTTGNINPLSLTTTGLLRVDGSGVTQTVSGTVTANAGTGNFTVVQATASNLNATVVGIGTDNTSNSTAKLPVIAAVATTSAPTYTNNNMVPLSTDTSGNLRVTGSFTSSGAGDTTATGTLGSLNATVQIAVTGQNGAGMQLVAGTLIGTIVPEISVDGGTTWINAFFDDPTTNTKSSSVVFGSSNTATTRSFMGVGGASHARIRVSAFTSGTTTCNLRASTMRDPSIFSSGPIGASTLPPDGMQIAGSVTTSAPTYSNGTLNALSLTTSGALRTETNLSDGTNAVAIKASGTAAATTDHALVVSISPNNSLVSSFASKSFNATTTQTGAAIWTPASGKKIAITSIVIGTYGTTSARLILWFGAGGGSPDTTYTAGTDQLLLAASFVPSATGYPGLVFAPSTPIFCANADYVLRCTTDSGLSVDIAAHGYEF